VQAIYGARATNLSFTLDKFNELIAPQPAKEIVLHIKSNI
jgi:hypothetical protein